MIKGSRYLSIFFIFLVIFISLYFHFYLKRFEGIENPAPDAVGGNVGNVPVTDPNVPQSNTDILQPVDAGISSGLKNSESDTIYSQLFNAENAILNYMKSVEQNLQAKYKKLYEIAYLLNTENKRYETLVILLDSKLNNVQSTIYQKGIDINNINNNCDPSKENFETKTTNFRENFVEALTINNMPISSGLKYTVYNDYFNKNPKWFQTARPISPIPGATTSPTGFVSNLASIENATNKFVNSSFNYYSVEWTGFFKANKTELYYFNATPEDNCFVWISESSALLTLQQLTTSSGTSESPIKSTTGIPLVEGQFYAIRIQFGFTYGSSKFNFSWRIRNDNNIYTNGDGILFHPDNDSFSIGYGAKFNNNATFSITQSITNLNNDETNKFSIVQNGNKKVTLDSNNVINFDGTSGMDIQNFKTGLSFTRCILVNASAINAYNTFSSAKCPIWRKAENQLMTVCLNFNTSSAICISESSVPQLNTWNHYVVTYDNNIKLLSLYKNGRLEGTAINTSIWNGDNGFHMLGAYGPGNFWMGMITNVLAFDYALNVSEVTQIYNQYKDMKVLPPPPPPNISTNLVSLYLFDNFNGTRNIEKGCKYQPISIIKSGVLKEVGYVIYLNEDPLYLAMTNNKVGITITGWVKSTTDTHWSRLFDFGNGAGSDNVLLSLRTGNNNQASGYVVVENRYAFHAPTPTNLNTNEWIFFAWTLSYSEKSIQNHSNGSVWTIYSGDSKNEPKVTYKNDNCLYPKYVKRVNNYIGKSNWGVAADPDSKAYYSNFRVYNTVLGETFIKEIWKTNAGQKPT